MTDTFTWKAQTNATGTSTFTVRTAQFGDGYSQAVADGINNEVQSWPLTIAGTKEQVQPAVDFLRAKGGYQSFYWTPPMGSQGLYRCASFTINESSGIYSLSATFQQVFV